MTFASPLIGILGGMGPQAGLDMADKLIAMTDTECDQDHIPFVLFSLPEPVVRERDIHAALYAPSFGIKTCPGAISEEASTRIHRAIRHLQKLGAEAIILGCTELPLAIKETRIDGIPILDPARIIAAKLIRETYPDKLVLSD